MVNLNIKIAVRDRKGFFFKYWTLVVKDLNFDAKMKVALDKLEINRTKIGNDSYNNQKTQLNNKINQYNMHRESFYLAKRIEDMDKILKDYKEYDKEIEMHDIKVLKTIRRKLINLNDKYHTYEFNRNIEIEHELEKAKKDYYSGKVNTDIYLNNVRSLKNVHIRSEIKKQIEIVNEKLKDLYKKDPNNRKELLDLANSSYLS